MSYLAYLDKLLPTVDSYNRKYPEGNSPFRIVAYLCEEAGEVASAVNHFEDTGAKRKKHGLPNKAGLAEIQDVIRTALRVAPYSAINPELKDSIHRAFRGKIDEGFIEAL